MTVERSTGLRTCYVNSLLRHFVHYPLCDCLRTELPIEARAKSSGSLATPGSAGLDAKRAPVHQHARCSIEKCGGEFTCEGCERVVGWCMGAGDELGAEHCDDCFCDRIAVLELIKKDGQQSRTALKLRVGKRAAAWQRDPVTVARELCEDGFLEFNRAGRFALTARGKAAF